MHVTSCETYLVHLQAILFCHCVCDFNQNVCTHMLLLLLAEKLCVAPKLLKILINYMKMFLFHCEAANICDQQAHLD